MDECPACFGSGTVVIDEKELTCEYCGGSGELPVIDQENVQNMNLEKKHKI